jgi:hypothetical protein
MVLMQYGKHLDGLLIGAPPENVLKEAPTQLLQHLG